MICDSERILNNAQCDVDRRLVLLFNLHKPQPGIILTSIILNKSSILLCYNSSFKTSDKKSKKVLTTVLVIGWETFHWKYFDVLVFSKVRSSKLTDVFFIFSYCTRSPKSVGGLSFLRMIPILGPWLAGHGHSKIFTAAAWWCYVTLYCMPCLDRRTVVGTSGVLDCSSQHGFSCWVSS